MADAFRKSSVQCLAPSGLYRMAYLEWGDVDNPRVLICVHGLTRCARDFDALAAELSAQYRVVCPDIAGRGASEWLSNPRDYINPTYVNAVVALIARLGIDSVDWVGTSMGGLVGMMLAALAHSPIKRLALNDVGPVIPASALQRIGDYVGKALRFPGIDAAEQHVRAAYAPFGPHTDREWRFLTEHILRSDPAGGYRMHYDPGIAVPFNAQQDGDIELWNVYDAVRCPTLVMRGEYSDVLTRETAVEMTARGPRATLTEIEGIGHAPTLMHPDQIAVVRQFLLSAL